MFNLFYDSISMGIIVGIIATPLIGWFVVICYAVLLCVYNFWIDKNAIYAPSSSGIFKYFCLGVFAIFVMVECFMWFRLHNIVGCDMGLNNPICDTLSPYVEFNNFFIFYTIIFWGSFVVAFFIVKFAFFIHRKLRKNSDEILCDFHKGKAIAFGIFVFITTPLFMYLVGNFKPLSYVGEYFFILLGRIAGFSVF